MKEKTTKLKRSRQSNNHPADQKCEAVLSLWTEKRRPSEICEAYRIKHATLNHWQDRALTGMLQALEPRVNLEKGPMLSPRLQKLLKKRGKLPEPDTSKLKERLSKIQSASSRMPGSKSKDDKQQKGA